MRRSILIAAIGFIVGFATSPVPYAIYSGFAATPGNVTKLNHNTINHVAVITQLLEQNSDIMSRFSHYTKPHMENVPHMLCPECYGTPPHIPEKLDLTPGADIVTTDLGAVYDDAHEVNKSVATITQGLLIQRDALEHTLRNLRGK